MVPENRWRKRYATMPRMILEKTLRHIALAGIFALPFVVFIVAQSLFFPYITGKNFAFRIIVEIIAGAWLALALVRPEYRPRKSWLLGAFSIFVILIAIADANGVYPFKSFWSNYERMDGWITLAHLLVYFVVASSILNTEKLWRSFWLFTLGVSSLVALHGILQALGIAATDQGFSSTTRVSAKFGNPIYLAGYMLFHVFIAAILVSRYGSERLSTAEKSFAWVFLGVFALSLAIITRTAVWEPYAALVLFSALVVWLISKEQKYLLCLLIALDALVLFLTGTRGTMLGLIGGALFSAILLAIFARDSKNVQRVVAGIVAGILILGSGFWLLRDAQWISRIGFLHRLATISTSDNTVKARFMNWGMAWEGVKERPLLGWGQENYAIVFDKYYNPKMYAQEQWFDRVHNIVFDWLVAGGFLGLLGYLSLFACALWCIWRKYLIRDGAGQVVNGRNVRQSNSGMGEFSVIEASILTGLLAGYFFHNLFVFDNITSYILFASVLAYIASRAGVAKGAPFLFSSKQLPPEAFPSIALIATIAVSGAVWGINTKAFSQNRALLQAIAPHQEGITKNLGYFKEAVGYRGLGTQEAREQLAQVALQIAGNQDIPAETKRGFYESGVRELALQAETSPLGARAPLFLGALLNAYGDYNNARQALERAHVLSPHKQTILFELGANAQVRGDNAAALKIFKDAYELAPEFSTARIYYATFAILMQEDLLADELLAPLMKSGGAANPRIAAAYVERKRYDKIAEIWQARVKAVPSDTQAYFTLAAALYTMGDSKQAIAQLEEVGRVTPSAKAQADLMIEQIRIGTAKAGE